MKFLNNWTINFDKLPSYVAFKGIFNVKLDYNILNECYLSDNKNFTNERKELLKPLLNKINKKNNILKIEHSQRFSIGRFYANQSISPICVSRHIKHTLFSYLDWVDLDMVKGHSSIIYSISKKNNIQLQAFEKYLNDPEFIFNELKKYYSDDEKITNDNIKDIFNIAIYGGSHNTWLNQIEEQEIQLKTKEPHKFVSAFIDDCKKVIDLVYLNNDELIKKVKGNLEDEYAIKKRVISYWCGAIENDILHICYKFLVKEGVIKDKSCCLEYDGLCFPKLKTDEELDNVLFNLNTKIFNDTGFNVKMAWKKYKPEYVHSDVIEKVKNMQNENIDIVEYPTFEEVSAKFEENHCKIVNKGIFIKELDDKIIIMSKANLITSYENIVYYKNEDIEQKPYSFIQSWLKNNRNQRQYEDIECFPPNVPCPPQYFNTWRCFKMELINDYKHHQEGLDMILNHIKILCNHEESVYNFFIKWIAQMIQYPSVKTICPTFISKEGAGKGTLLYLFRQMMGDEKVFETTSPSRDVWGDFNGIMANAFLVNLDELSKSESQNSEGRIKGLITNPRININNKGVNSYSIYSYHRFINFTNNDEPLKVDENSRRNLIIKSSNEKINDKEYFNEMYKLLNNIDVVKTCYEYFKNIENMDKFNLIEIPKTEYQNDLTLLEKSPIELWLKDYTYDNINETIINVMTNDLYKSFKDWCNINHSSYEINLIKFSVRLKNLNIDGLETLKTNKANKKIIDIEKMKKYFKIVNDEVDFVETD
jgi:hypothetical protein